MKQLLLRSASSPAPSLLIFCNGWAMTRAAIEHLALPSGYDLLLVEDYRRLDFSFDFSPYTHVDLVAWSMGVWAATLLHLQGQLPPLSKAIAIAGTPYPRHDDWGIPCAIFDATRDNLSEENRERFNRRMCGGKRLRHLFDSLKTRSTEELITELSYAGSHPLFASKQGRTPWTHAIIPIKDRIIPAANQLAWWQTTDVAITTLPEADHYPFGAYSQWEQLLSPDTLPHE
jgi:dethiobiotin synthase